MGKKVKLSVSFLILLFFQLGIKAEVGYKLSLKPESKLWLNGKSTLHDFESDAAVISIDSAIELKTGPKRDDGVNQELLKEVVMLPEMKKFVLEIPVKDLKSGIPGLAWRMHNSLKYKEHPNIIFRMTEYKSEAAPAKKNQYAIKLIGVLEVAGKENQISIESIAETTGQYIKVTGKKELLMTDFGIKPPVLMFGTIKTDNKVVISWEIILIPESTDIHASMH